MRSHVSIVSTIIFVLLSTSLFTQTPPACGIVTTDNGAGIPAGTLVDVNLDDGTVSAINPLTPLPAGFISAGTLIDGLLYAISQSNVLFTVDPVTGATNTIGNPVPSAGGNWGGLALHPDGTLYAMASDGATTDLYSIDIISGSATLVGNIPGVFGIFLVINKAGEAFVGSIDPDGIVSIDLSTGAPNGALIPILDGPGGTPIDLNFGQDASFGCIEGTSMLYGTIFDFGLFGTRIGTLDPVTGVFTTLNTFGGQISSFAVKPLPSAGIPTLGEWGLICLSLMIFILGVSYIKQGSFSSLSAISVRDK